MTGIGMSFKCMVPKILQSLYSIYIIYFVEADFIF